MRDRLARVNTEAERAVLHRASRRAGWEKVDPLLRTPSRFRLAAAIAVSLALLFARPLSAAANETAAPKLCGPVTIEDSFPIPAGRAIHRVIRVTPQCGIAVDTSSVISIEEAKQLEAAERPAQNRSPLSVSSAHRGGPGVNAPLNGLVAGPIHMKLRLLDVIGLDVTSINPHDLTYGWNGSVITSVSHSAYQTWATDNSGFCGSGYYGWHPANGGLSVSGGGVGYYFVDSLAHAEFWYNGYFSHCDPYQFYNILDTKLTGFGSGSAPACAYRLQLARTVFGWHTDLLCWDAYGNSVTPPPF
jgi:hypothetical protein